jgi:hypothetical protein
LMKVPPTFHTIGDPRGGSFIPILLFIFFLLPFYFRHIHS